jgi:hypothetical protein
MSTVHYTYPLATLEENQSFNFRAKISWVICTLRTVNDVTVKPLEKTPGPALIEKIRMLSNAE